MQDSNCPVPPEAVPPRATTPEPKLSDQIRALGFEMTEPVHLVRSAPHIQAALDLVKPCPETGVRCRFASVGNGWECPDCGRELRQVSAATVMDALECVAAAAPLAAPAPESGTRRWFCNKCGAAGDCTSVDDAARDHATRSPECGYLPGIIPPGATIARLEAQNRELWQIIRQKERDAYAASNGLDVAELDARCSDLAIENTRLRAALTERATRAETALREVLDAIGVEPDDEGDGYWVLGKLAAYHCETLVEAARDARNAPEHRWYKHVARAALPSDAPGDKEKGK